MKIAFTGPQGSGKTTLINELKKDEKFKDFTFIESPTRSMLKKGLKINENGDDNTQKAIMNYHKEKADLEGDIIYDRCALDCLCYTFYLLYYNKISFITYASILYYTQEVLDKYDVIFYTEPDFELVGDNERSSNVRYRDMITDFFKLYIKKLGIRVIKLKGSVKDRMKKIRRTTEHVIKSRSAN